MHYTIPIQKNPAEKLTAIASGIALVMWPYSPVPTAMSENFGSSVFAVCSGWMIHPTAKAREEVNRKLPPRNTMVKSSMTVV